MLTASLMPAIVNIMANMNKDHLTNAFSHFPEGVSSNPSVQYKTVLIGTFTHTHTLACL